MGNSYIEDEDDEDFDFVKSSRSNEEPKPSIEASDKHMSYKDNDYRSIHKGRSAEQIAKYETGSKTYKFNNNMEEMLLLQPEDVDKMIKDEEAKKAGQDTHKYADPIIADAVKNVEAKLKRQINFDEFDKLCRSYAAYLVQQDAERMHTRVNASDYEAYYNTLIRNKKVTSLYKARSSQYERGLVDEIDDLLNYAKSYVESDIRVQEGTPLNIRHKGNVIIRDDKRGVDIKINNKNDVELLRMKYRKDKLDQIYREQINKTINPSNDDIEDDGWE